MKEDTTVVEIPEVPTIETRRALSALPLTVDALMANRKKPMDQSLNNMIEQLHLQLWTDPVYRRLLDAVYVEQAVEGDLKLDDAEAARMIRTMAQESDGFSYVAAQKLSTICKALRVVLRRFNIPRDQRREI